MTAGLPAGLFATTRSLSEWRRRGVALGLGVFAAGALPPLYLVFLLPPALAGFLWLAWCAPRPRDAFFAGWWFGIGHCAAGYFWISASLLVTPEKHAWLIPLAVIGFAGVLGVFPAFAAGALNAFRDRLGADRLAPPGIAGAAACGALWVLFEWVRGWIFTGFPWNLMGSVWGFSDAMMQPASVIGVFGLGLVTVTAALWLFTGGRGIALGLGLLAIVFGYGQFRLSGANLEFAEGVNLRLVQPNIQQAVKWRRDLRAGHVARQLEMSAQPPELGRPPPTHIIWAETAVPFILNRQPELIRALARVTPRGGVLMTGALRAGGAPDGRLLPIHNSLFAIEPSGRLATAYDKAHLVPFGEYVPLHDWFDFLDIAIQQGSFTPGPGLQTLTLKGLPPMTPLICYEVIFPGAVTPGDGPRPEWLLNITNDAWFGRSPGPYQHYALTRLRAVEEGLPIVRVANTGISAVIDPWGRETAALELGVADVIDSGLPRALDGLTAFARFGNAIPLALIAVMLAGAAIGLRRTAQHAP